MYMMILRHPPLLSVAHYLLVFAAFGWTVSCLPQFPMDTWLHAPFIFSSTSTIEAICHAGPGCVCGG